MFLSHGLDDNGQLISIDDTDQGRTSLHCPFCGQVLIAKKGKVKEHHFAHDGVTCAESKKTLAMTGIPLFDSDGLSKAQITLLKKLSRWRTFSRLWLTENQKLTLDSMLVSGLLVMHDDQPTLTEVARHLLYGVSGHTLSGYVQLQEALFVIREKELVHYDAQNGTQTARFYRTRLATLLQQHLYVLHIKFEQDNVCYPLFKVGLTRRSIEQRIGEIKNDLNRFGRVHEVQLIGLFPHFGSLERRLLSILHTYQHVFGQHTEYSDSLIAGQRLHKLDLKNIGKRNVDGHIVHVKYRNHGNKVQGGQRRVQFLYDRHLGRPQKSQQEILKDYPDVVEAYHNGLSLRSARSETGRSINTIRKVYDALRTEQS